MKKRLSFVFGIVLYLALAILLSGYGNKLSHPALNEYIIEGFQNRYTDNIRFDKFKNYNFDFSEVPHFLGTSVSKGGFLEIEESQANWTPTEWIKHGGASADEPNLPASFRHFYDPAEPEGERYLKDHLDFLVNAIGIDFNPRIDHLDWSLYHEDHLYNWVNGKNHMRLSLQQADETKKGKEMAFAFRALGETLHMIADLACPPHVRDDSHPAMFGVEGILSYFGNPDPYEEFFETMVDQIPEWSMGNVDLQLKQDFDSSKTVYEIAHDLAVYTNTQYFTNQTITGKTVEPQIHPEKTYGSPLLEQCAYSPTTYLYTKPISGHSVKMCKDLSYLLWLVESRGSPYIDKECVETQAAALVPQLLEAGAQVMRLFYPKMDIEIEELSNGEISGSVTHHVDREYIEEIRYNGTVSIYRSQTDELLVDLVCENGKFEGEFDEASIGINWDEEGLVAKFKFANVEVESEVFNKNSSDYIAITIVLSSNSMKYDSGEPIAGIGVLNRSSCTNHNDPNYDGILKWDGRSFSSNSSESCVNGIRTDSRSWEVSGVMSKNLRTIEEVSTDWDLFSSWADLEGRSSRVVHSISLQNVDLSEFSGYLQIDIIGGANIEPLISSLDITRTTTGQFGTKVERFSTIDWNDPEMKLKVVIDSKFY